MFRSFSRVPRISSPRSRERGPNWRSASGPCADASSTVCSTRRAVSIGRASRAHADDDASMLGLESATLPGGRYARIRLIGEPPAVYALIAPTMEKLAQRPDCDPGRPSVEVYRRRDVIDLLQSVVQAPRREPGWARRSTAARPSLARWLSDKASRWDGAWHTDRIPCMSGLVPTDTVSWGWFAPSLGSEPIYPTATATRSTDRSCLSVAFRPADAYSVSACAGRACSRSKRAVRRVARSARRCRVAG